MTDPRYEALKKKYQALVTENKRLKEKLRQFSAGGQIKLPPEPASVPEAEAEGVPVVLDSPGVVTHLSPESHKIALFIDLFRGRPDVFARRWKSKKGKAGYSPACLNEWRPGICGKPKIRCGSCTHKDYAALSPAVIDAHLRGKIVAGIYPLARGDTCYFLAMDFDKKGWEKDISVIRDTCSRHDIPVAVERSRSGNGGHVWFFFREPLPAALARKFGSAILTHAMGNRHEISFASYDRLFPNQDTLPTGGLGNLIALPLQHSPRSLGNSVFIDEQLSPYPDQWAFLSGIEKLDEIRIQRLIAKLVPEGVVLGTLKIDPEEDKGRKSKPWKKRRVKLGASDFPGKTTIVKSGMIYLEKSGFSSRALNQIKRFAAFSNPEFYKAQAMRKSTFGKPRIISCSEDFKDYLALPRGCEPDVLNLLSAQGVEIVQTDETFSGKIICVSFNGELRPEQKDALDALTAQDTGVLSAATAFGKTVVGAGLIAKRRINTLVLVHRRQLLSQWRERLSQFLAINETLPELPVKRGRKIRREIIGHMEAGKDRLNFIVDIALMQSMNARGKVKDAVRKYGMILVDECHHVPAVTVEQILKTAPAKYVYGLTATPARADGHHPIIFFYCGPVRYAVDAGSQAAERPFDHLLTPRFTAFRVPEKSKDTPLPIHDIKARLISDEIRNQLIADDVIDAYEKGRNSLVLTGRVAHVHTLGQHLEKKCDNVICLTGGLGAKKTDRILARIKSIPDDDPFILVSTGSFAGEGFDEPRLDTLFLAMPISWKGTLQQYAGRLHRLRDNKTEVRIYDYVDLHVGMLERMYAKRLKGYAAMGYKVRGETFPGAPVNLIFNKDNFFPVYLNDIQNASSQLLIVSPFTTQKRMRQMMGYFIPLMEKQVAVHILTRPADHFSSPKKEALEALFSEVRSAGIHLTFKPNIHQKFAVIDQRISWYGSINLLSFGYSEESIMRLESSSIAYELNQSTGL